MTNQNPSRVKDIALYWTEAPPERSARCAWWVERIRAGWKLNRRIGGLGYHGRCEFFGVYMWEYLNVLCPLLDVHP